MIRIPYSKAARQMFTAIDKAYQEGFNPVDHDMPTCSWVVWSSKDGSNERSSAMFHGMPEAHEACDAIKPRIAEMFKGTPELSPLQAIEVQCRALLMGDICAFFDELIGSGLVMRKGLGEHDIGVTTRNPYYRALHRALREAEKLVPAVKVSKYMLPKWTDGDVVEGYCVRFKELDNNKIAVGVAMLDRLAIPVIDLAGVLD